MGFELKRLMRERGVATPGMVAYSGQARPTDPGADASAADKAAFQEALRKYNIDQNAYNQYRQEYERRITETPQYLQSQFDTSTGANVPAAVTFSPAQMAALRPGSPNALASNSLDRMNRDIRNYFADNPNASAADVFKFREQYGLSEQDIRNAMGSGFKYGSGTSGYGSAGMNAATAKGGIGMDQYNANIRNWFAERPFATNEQIAAEQAKYGISNRDLYGAMGSYFGNTLRAPGYGSIDPALQNMTAQQKADYYAQQRRIGYTDADLRAMAERAFGPQTNENWNLLQTMAGYGLANPDSRSTLPTDPERRTALNTTGGTTGVTTTTTNPQAITFNVTQASTPEQKAAELNRLLNAGYTNDQIRNAATTQFGQQTDADWNNLYNLASTLTPGYTPPSGPITALPITLPDTTVPGIPSLPTLPGGFNRDFNDKVLPFSHGGGVHDMAQKYNIGGAVKRFRMGGMDGEEEEGGAQSFPVAPQAELRGVELPPMQRAARSAAPEAPTAPTVALQPVTASPAARPITPPALPSTPVSPAAGDLMAMLQRYTSDQSPYAADLAAARGKVETESKAFENLLKTAMKPGSTAPDKTELYFRLAAAFGAPTRTGSFGETLSGVGKELSEYAKETRASKKAEQQLALQLGLEAQKMRMQGAREELGALRGLAAEEMKDKRAILLEYLKSGRPQSEAGKAAIDAGYAQGTPEFNTFVKEYIDDKVRSGNALKEAMVLVAQGNLAVAQAGLGIRQSAEERAKESAKKLTPGELKLKTETEDRLTTIDSAMTDLGRAYDLNKNSFDTTLKDTAVRTALEQTGSKDPKVLSTREMDNLLKSGMISGAAEKMKGVLSDSDIKLLQSVSGLDAKSKEERAAILKNAYRSLRTARLAQQKRLNEISQGLYRETSPAPAGPGED